MPKAAHLQRPSDKLSLKTRITLGMPRYAPRKRQPNEATPTVICNGMVPSHTEYRTGDGEVRQAQRPGSTQALAIPSHGFRT